MGARPLRKIVVGLLPLMLLGAQAAYGIQDNAVGGSVWSRADEKPLAGVTVVLAQNEEIKDTTREQDGVYVLRVPRSMKSLHLVFKHPTHMPVTRPNLQNEESQQKVKIVKMASSDSSAIRQFDDAVIQQLISDAKSDISRTASGGDVPLWEAGTSTLTSLLDAADKFDKTAQQETAAGNYAVSESLLKKALYIKERILSEDDPAVLETIFLYGALLDKLDRKEEARKLGGRLRIPLGAPASTTDREDGVQFFKVLPRATVDRKELRLGNNPVETHLYLRRLGIGRLQVNSVSDGEVVNVTVDTNGGFLDLRVLDETGKIVTTGNQGSVSWPIKAGGMYRVYMINKTSRDLILPVRISLGSQR